MFRDMEKFLGRNRERRTGNRRGKPEHRSPGTSSTTRPVPRQDMQVMIPREEYEALAAKAEKYDALVKEHEELRALNEKLEMELEDLRVEREALETVKRTSRKYQERAEAYLKSLKRVQADFENFRKVTQRNAERTRLRALQSTLKKLLAHRDDLQRVARVFQDADLPPAVQSGFSMLLKNYDKMLAEEGLRRMECEGKRCDPYQHEVLDVVDRDDVPEDTIVEELAPGYYFHDNVIRPARVRVARTPNPGAGDTRDTSTTSTSTTSTTPHDNTSK